ncbi:FHA domain-containing protein [Deltaproteobacteria bacterium PRO3]|nr:FHA domain-containing protein [Deltaproteobacteria bacterium PRO3]
MANGIPEQRGLYGAFQQWYRDAKIPAQEVDLDRDGQAKPREVVAYVLSHLDKFSPKVQKQVDALRQAFRGLGFADAEAVQLLTGELKDGAHRLVGKGKDFEKKAAAAAAENKAEEAARLLDLAEKSYRLALDLRPHTRLAHQALADLLYRGGKNEAARGHVAQVILRSGEKIPELMTWLQGLKDPEIQRQGAVAFAGEVLLKESEHKTLASLYEWAGLDAARRGDSDQAKRYEEKCLLADELARPYRLDFAQKDNPRLFALYEALRRAGIPSGLISGNRLDNRVYHTITAAQLLNYVDRHAADPKVREALKSLGLMPPPWESSPFSADTFFAGKAGFTEKLGAYHAKMATLAVTPEARFQHLEAAVHYRPEAAETQLGMAHYYLGKNQLKEAEPYLLNALRLAPQTPGLQDTLKATQLNHMNHLGERIQADLREADALLAQGEIAAAEKLVKRAAQTSEARFDHHAKMLWEEPNHQLRTSRLDAQLKFQQARLLEAKAKTADQFSEAHFLYVLAESSAQVALSKDPKDAAALEVVARVGKIQVGQKQQGAALQEEREIRQDLDRADELLRDGKTEAAKKLLSKAAKALQVRQDNHGRFFEEGTDFHARGARLEAELKFHQARALDGKKVAQGREAQDLYLQAEKAAAALLKQDPKDKVARRLLERLEQVRNLYKDSALKQDQEIHKGLRRVDALLAQGKTEEAQRLLQKTWVSVDARWNHHSKLLAENPYFKASTAAIDAELKFHHARILERQAQTQDQWVEAAKVYEAAEASATAWIERAPKDDKAHLLRARIRHVRENYKGAVEDYGSALAKAPDAAAKERIALQWSFYLEELKNLKTELKRMRGLWKDMAVPPPPFDQYRLQNRELAVTRALQAVAGSGLDQGLWIPDPKLKGPQIAEAKIQAFQEIGKEVGELEQGVKNLGSEAALKTYHEGVNKVLRKAGLKTSDLPADLQNLVEIGPEGQVIFKPEPPSPAGTISVHGKSEVERKLSTLQKLDNLAFVRWNERQAAASADPVQKLFYETQALLRQDKIHATRLKMADFHAAVKAQVAADPGYLEKNPEIGAMYEQTKLVLKEISLKSLDQLGEFNELNLAQRAAMEYVPKTTQAKLNKVMIHALRAEIESGRALTLDEAMRNLKAEYQRQKAAGEAFQVHSHNMIHPGTKFDALTPGRPETLAYLFDGYLGWEKDKGFKALLEAELRPGLEQRLSPDQDRRYSLELAKTLRGNSDYSTAAELLEKLFGKDLEAAKQKISPDRIQEIKTEVQTKDRAKLEKEIREAFKKNKSRVQLSREDTDKAVEEALAAQKLRGDADIPGGDAILQKDIRERIEKRRAELTEPLIQKALDQAVAAKVDLKIRSEAYGHMPNMVGNHDPIAQEAWKIFNDMKDPNDEWDNLADHSWDALKTEAIVMAVTLPLTLGVGTAVRAGMSGTKLAIRMLNAGRWAGAATKGGILITGAAAEGLVQTFLTSAIHNRDFQWKEVGFNIVTSLAFHGGNRLWGKFADKLGIGDRAIQAALQRGESVVGMKVGNFAGMMLVQTELSAAMNYALETIQGHPGPGFWTLERHLGEGVRQLAYHGGTKVLNIATRNWAANAELRAKLKAEVAQDHYQQLMKQGKLSAPEARKLAAERAHQEIPSVLDGQDPKQIGAMLAVRKSNRLVEKLGMDPDSAEGKTLAYILQHATDLPGAEKALGEFKDLDGFVRERLNLDPTSQHGKVVMKQFAEALAHGKKSEALLREFPELGRLLEAQEVAAKQLLAKAGMDQVKGQDALAKALVALALERGYGAEDLGRFGEVLAQQPELLKNIVDKFGGDAKAPFSKTSEGRQLAGMLLVDAMRASPDFDAFAATLKNMEAHANYHLSDVDQAGLLLGGIPLSDRVALFRWSAKEGRGQHEWSADLQGMLEGRVQFRIGDGRVERVERSEAEGAGAQRATAKQFASLNDGILAWAHTENFSAANQKLAMEGMADRVLRSAGYKPGSAEYRAHRDFLLKHFESVARGETNPEDGHWPKVAVDLEAHLRSGGTMTYLNKDGSQYKLGPAQRAKPKAVAESRAEDTKVDRPKGKGAKQKEVAPQPDEEADSRGKDAAKTEPQPLTAAARGQADRVGAPTPVLPGDKTVKAGRDRRTPTPTQPAEGSKTEAAPESPGLLLSADGLDGYSVPSKAEKSVHWSSRDKKLPGDPWALDLNPRDGGFDLVPKNGKIQYEEGGKWVDVPKGGMALKDGMSLKLGDLEFHWRAPGKGGSGHYATGTRQAGEHLVGELFDYYGGKDTRTTLAQFAERRDAWGEEARAFQQEFGKLEGLWNEYRSLEKDYRKQPSLAKREALNKKWKEVQDRTEGLHNSKYHRMERAHAAAMLETKAKLAPLEIFLGVESFPSLQQARQISNERPDFAYELNFSPPEKIGVYADDWSRVPAKEFVQMNVRVAGAQQALDLVQKMRARGEFEMLEGLKWAPDRKSGEVTVLVKSKGVENGAVVETSQRIVLKFEVGKIGTSSEARIGHQIREEREQLDLMRAEISRMKARKADPAEIASYEKILTEAEATFRQTLAQRQYTVDGLPYAKVMPDITRQIAGEVFDGKATLENRTALRERIVADLERQGIKVSTDNVKSVDSMIDLALTAKAHGIVDQAGGLTRKQFYQLVGDLYLHNNPAVRIGAAELTHVPMVVEGTLVHFEMMAAAKGEKPTVAEKKAMFLAALYHDAGKWDPDIRTKTGYTILKTSPFNKTGADIVVKAGQSLKEALAEQKLDPAKVTLPFDGMTAILVHHDAETVRSRSKELVKLGILDPLEAQRMWEAIQYHGFVSSWVVKNSLAGLGIKSHVFNEGYDKQLKPYLEAFQAVSKKLGEKGIPDIEVLMRDADFAKQVQTMREAFGKLPPYVQALMLGDHQGQIDVAKYMTILSSSPANKDASLHDLFFAPDMTNSVLGVLRTHSYEQILLSEAQGRAAAPAFSKAEAWLRETDPKKTGLAQAVLADKDLAAGYEKWRATAGPTATFQGWLKSLKVKQDGKNSPEFVKIQGLVEASFYRYYALSPEAPLHWAMPEKQAPVVSDQADPWAVSTVDKVEAAPRAGEPAADRRPAGGLPGLVAGLVTLLAPDLAHAADKAAEASGGGTAPWIVGATLLVLGGIGGLVFKLAKGKAAGQSEAPPPLPQRRAVAWDQAPPQRPPLDAPRPAVETTPPRVPVVDRVPEVFSTFKLGLEHRAIDLGVLPPKVQELDVFVGDPAKLSDKAGLAVVIQDSVSSGEPVLRGKLRREGAGWIFYPVEATDVFGGNLQPKAPRPDGFIPVENHDYFRFGMGWFQVEGQTLRQAPGSPEVSLHFRDGTGHARAQADRVAPLPHPDQALRDQPPAPSSDPLYGAKALLAENEPGRPRRGTVLKTQATEEYGISAAKTHEGVGKSYNEDGFVQGKDWAVVIDEVGTGGSHGKAGKVFGEAVAKYMAEHAGDGPPAQVFQQALLAGGEAIHASPYARSSVVAVGHFIVKNPDGSRTAVLVHVGDAVGMVIGKDGRIKHRTQDQSLVEDLVEKNLAAEGLPATARKLGLHTDDVELMKRAHPRSNVVLGSLGGGKNTLPVVTEVRLEAGDRIVMMSDGVSDSVSSREIAGQALAAKNPGQAMDGIFNTAFGRMGSAHEAMGAKREWKLQWGELGPGERIEVLRDGKKRYMRRDLDEATHSYVYSVYSAKEGGILIESFSRPLGLRTPITTPDGQQRWIDQNANIWDRQSGGTLLDHYKPSDNITVHVYFHETAEGGAGKTEAKKGEPPVPGGTEIPADARRLLETKGSLVLGRVGDWVLGSPQDKKSLISGRQATLSYKREGDRDVYELRDGAQSPKGWVASLNGTFVNGRRLPSGEAVTLKDGDILQMGHEKITWTAQRKAGDGDLSRTITAGDWAIVHPHLYQAKQFTQENLLEGTPVNGLEVPGRSAVYMEGAGRYAEDPANREIIVWDRSQDVVVRDFLAQAQEQVRRAIGKEFLDPQDPNFERDLQLAMSIYNFMLRKEFRDPGEDAKGALRRLDAFIADKRDQKILVGEMLKRKFPFCRHLALLTQAFLADMGVRKVQMVRGSIIGGAHVWNEVEIGGQRRVIEITDAFYAGSHPLLPPDINIIYHHEPRAGRVQ